MKTTKLFIIFILFTFNLSLATVINVPADQPTIQDGINTAVEGDTVLVASGTYYENIIWPETNGIILIGSGQDECIIEGGEGSVITFNGNHDYTTIISDFTITHGGINYTWGLGISLESSSPTLKRLKIWGNSTDYINGSGIYMAYSEARLENVLIIGNDANNDAEADGGGGIYMYNSSPILTNVTIKDNIDWGGMGGGIYCRNSNPVLVNCIISGNYGTGLFVESGDAHVYYSDFYDNEGFDDYDNFYGLDEMVGINSLENANGDSCDVFFNLLLDPLYNIGGSTLQPNSPCIDAGTSFFVFEGDTLVNMSEDEYIGYAPDMGAFEYDDVVYIDPVEYSPKEFMLRPAYPNPFNPITTIEYDIPKDGHITLTIYDIMGRKVKELVNKHVSIGTHTIIWNGTNQNGDRTPSGMYFYHLKADDYVETRKLILLK